MWPASFSACSIQMAYTQFITCGARFSISHCACIDALVCVYFFAMRSMYGYAAIVTTDAQTRSIVINIIPSLCLFFNLVSNSPHHL